MPSGGFAQAERWLRSGRAVASLRPSGGFAQAAITLEVLRSPKGRLLDLEKELDVGLGPLHLVEEKF